MSIGIWELLVILAIALVVIGPERFPEFLRVVMRTVRDFRSYVDDVKHDISEELKPVKKEIDALGRYDPQEYLDEVARAVGEAGADVEKAEKPAPSTPDADTEEADETPPDDPARLDG